MDLTILYSPLPFDERLSSEVRKGIEHIYADKSFITTYRSLPKNLLQLCSLACFVNGQPVTGKSIRYYLQNRCEDIENNLSMPIETLIFLQEMRKCRSDVFNHALESFIFLLSQYFPEVPTHVPSKTELVSFADIALHETARLIDRLHKTKI